MLIAQWTGVGERWEPHLLLRGWTSARDSISYRIASGSCLLSCRNMVELVSYHWFAWGSEPNGTILWNKPSYKDCPEWEQQVTEATGRCLGLVWLWDSVPITEDSSCNWQGWFVLLIWEQWAAETFPPCSYNMLIRTYPKLRNFLLTA